MLPKLVLFETYRFPLKFLSGEVANEAERVLIHRYLLELLPHFSESVNNDTGNDGGDDQVNEEHIKDVIKLRGKRYWAFGFIGRRVYKSIIDMESKAIQKVLTFSRLFIQGVLASELSEEVPHDVPVFYNEEQENGHRNFMKLRQNRSQNRNHQFVF